MEGSPAASEVQDVTEEELFLFLESLSDEDEASLFSETSETRDEVPSLGLMSYSVV